MKLKRLILPSLMCALLLVGCATQRQLIEKRIGQKSDFFAALPAEHQQRLRDGKVQSGDTHDAVWIVYGRPDRIFQKVTATSTNEVWSYVAQNLDTYDEPRPVYYPLRASGGRTIWHTDYIWAPRTRFDTYEYMRIEFQNDKVLSVETEQP